MTCILTLPSCSSRRVFSYCKRRSVPYSQGLNEIVAPLFFVGVSRDVKFQLFYAIVQRFFPLLFRGDNMRRHLDPLMHCLRVLLQ